jgi:hypothetical protein
LWLSVETRDSVDPFNVIRIGEIEVADVWFWPTLLWWPVPESLIEITPKPSQVIPIHVVKVNGILSKTEVVPVASFEGAYGQPPSFVFQFRMPPTLIVDALIRASEIEAIACLARWPFVDCNIAHL